MEINAPEQDSRTPRAPFRPFLGQIVQQHRQAKGWTRRQLARQVQVLPRFITMIEEERYQSIGDTTIRRLAAALDTAPSELWAALGVKGARPAEAVEGAVAV